MSECAEPAAARVTRAKFRCQNVVLTQYAAGQELDTLPRTYNFQAAYDITIPEDQRYAKATPVGQMSMQVDNPAVAFVPGKNYYLDITEAD